MIYEDKFGNKITDSELAAWCDTKIIRVPDKHAGLMSERFNEPTSDFIDTLMYPLHIAYLGDTELAGWEGVWSEFEINCGEVSVEANTSLADYLKKISKQHAELKK